MNYQSYYSISKSDNLSSNNYSFINLAGQAVVGSVLAVGFFIPPMSASFVSSFGENNEPLPAALAVLAFSSYVFGAGVGVYWVAKSENQKLSFWKTVGYSAIGSGVSIIMFSILANNYTKIPAVGGTIAALFPVIGAMLYASFISDWPQEPQKISFVKNNFTFNDIFEHSKLFNIELFRIKL